MELLGLIDFRRSPYSKIPQMLNTFLDTKLAQLGLTLVPLKILHPDELTYTGVFMQPLGDLNASPDGIENADNGIAVAKHSSFLQIANDL